MRTDPCSIETGVEAIESSATAARKELNMPVVFRWKGCKFFFFSNEGDPREPLHIHVRCHGARAKFWLGPVAVAENIGFAAHELSDLTRVVNDNQDKIERAWHEHFGD